MTWNSINQGFDFCTLDKLAVKNKENLPIVFFLDLNVRK